jgi:hypothetical protein
LPSFFFSSAVKSRHHDWKKWLMTKPYRPFDPQLYFEFRLYREFSSGIPDQWMSHGIDLVHFFMNDQPPRSVMAHGGVFATGRLSSFAKVTLTRKKQSGACRLAPWSMSNGLPNLTKP